MTLAMRGYVCKLFLGRLTFKTSRTDNCNARCEASVVKDSTWSFMGVNLY